MGGIKCKYDNENESLKSGISQFNGSQIYDEDEFLTSLLIRSHLIQPTFQQACKKIFTNPNIIGVDTKKCHYTKGSVKLRDRCIVTATIDYNNKKWPKTSNILDFLRCGFVCDNPTILN